MSEIWKKVINYENYYEVSNLGRIRSLYKNIIMKPTSHYKTKYLQVGLRKPGEKRKTASLHRLIAEVFCENPKNKKVVNHKNGNKLDNRALNLEWVTKKENEEHAVKLGLRNDFIGENNISNKLKETEVLVIKEMLKNGISQSKIAKKFNVSQSTISFINVGKIWNHL